MLTFLLSWHRPGSGYFGLGSEPSLEEFQGTEGLYGLGGGQKVKLAWACRIATDTLVRVGLGRVSVFR